MCLNHRCCGRRVRTRPYGSVCASCTVLCVALGFRMGGEAPWAVRRLSASFVIGHGAKVSISHRRGSQATVRTRWARPNCAEDGSQFVHSSRHVLVHARDRLRTLRTIYLVNCVVWYLYLLGIGRLMNHAIRVDVAMAAVVRMHLLVSLSMSRRSSIKTAVLARELCCHSLTLLFFCPCAGRVLV